MNKFIYSANDEFIMEVLDIKDHENNQTGYNIGLVIRTNKQEMLFLVDWFVGGSGHNGVRVESNRRTLFSTDSNLSVAKALGFLVGQKLMRVKWDKFKNETHGSRCIHDSYEHRINIFLQTHECKLNIILFSNHDGWHTCQYRIVYGHRVQDGGF